MPIIPESAQEYARGYERFAGTAAELSSQSTPAWTVPPTAGEDAPNVILMLVDDMGFSDIAPFGGEIDTPHLDAVSDDGYRLTNYRTAPMCSPARAALLTGLNPHRAGFATVAHGDAGYPGATLQIADDVPTIAESFRAGGYATFLVGKWHLTKESLLNDAADKSSWPLQRGFDRYFGSMDGFTTLHQPHRLVSDNSPLTVDDFPDDYYLTDDLTDRALGMIKALRASEGHKPFFLYFAHQAVHAPLQAKPGDLDKYRGAYQSGWDHIRDIRFRRQIEQGLFPEGTEPGPRNTAPGAEVAVWDELTPERQDLFARYMETYAAMIDNLDQNLGRLISHLKRIGEYENTIIAFTSDNGATGEGGAAGTRSYFSQFGFHADLPERWQRDVPRDPDLIGGPRAFVHYPRGWAYASNTPFRYYKRDTFEGGVHAPLLLSWPRGLPRRASDDGLRDQFAYVTDLGLTLLDLAGVPRLSRRNGVAAKEVDGVPFARLLRDRSEPSPRTTQYSEMVGNRSLYDGRWKIVTRHLPGTAFTDTEWELYDIAADPTERHDLAAQNPEIVQQMAAQWNREAWHNTVFPLDDDGTTRSFRPSTDLVYEQPVTLYPDTPTLERYRSSKLIRLRDVEIAARFSMAGEDAGVLVAHGDQGGGYVLFIEDGQVCVSYNQFGEMQRIAAPIGPGTHEVVVRFTCRPELAWDVALIVDGQQRARLDDLLQMLGMAPFTGISVGVDRGSPVDWNLHERFRSFPFTGSELEVTYTPGERAAYNPEVIKQVERVVNRMYE
ncbi:arylsulfatase [Microbacterium kribbense]|uniref:Arylsulfatase n=1 Tax=Microbacterium kribbense TaxID=433645 RepID=A0ABP7G1U2_9MICO